MELAERVDTLVFEHADVARSGHVACCQALDRDYSRRMATGP